MGHPLPTRVRTEHCIPHSIKPASGVPAEHAFPEQASQGITMCWCTHHTQHTGHTGHSGHTHTTRPRPAPAGRLAGMSVLTSLRSRVPSSVTARVLTTRNRAMTFAQVRHPVLAGVIIRRLTGGSGSHGPSDGAGGDAAATVSPRTVSAQIERVVVAARKAGLTGALTVRPPASPTSTWQVNERWVPWRTTSDAVSVDGRDGGIVDRQDFGDLPLFSRLSAWGIYLHMGIMFGLPLQIALCVVGLGIALIVVQGYRMWWRRRPTRPGSRAGLAGVPGVPSTLPWRAYGCVVVFAVTVGVFLPLVGVSLVVFTVLDAAL
ncbi:hypothetical protein CXF37_03305, partial [Corynebacterium bovis]